MILLVPFVQELFKLPAGLTLLSAIVVLVVMTLPTIISVSESSITAVPKDYMEASLALGVNKDYTILHIIIPAAKSGILSAILLGLGRAVGETMAVIMVAGNVAQMPKLLEPVRFLTTAIVTEMAYASQETSGVLMGIGLVLFVFIVVINGLFYVLIKRTAWKCIRKGGATMELKSKIRIRFILFRALVILLTVAVAGLAAGLIGYILKKGLPYVSWEFLTTEPDILMDTYGIKPMIINTIYTVVLTLLFCIPLGIGSAIYLAEYAKQGKIVSAIRFAIEILAGIPSIVYGLFGLDFFVRKMSIGDYAGSMLAASLTLTLIVLPTMIRTTEESLLAVSSSYREAAAAMGLSKFYTIRKVILPCAISGIVVAIILSIGR